MGDSAGATTNSLLPVLPFEAEAAAPPPPLDSRYTVIPSDLSRLAAIPQPEFYERPPNEISPAFPPSTTAPCSLEPAPSSSAALSPSAADHGRSQKSTRGNPRETIQDSFPSAPAAIIPRLSSTNYETDFDMPKTSAGTSPSQTTTESTAVFAPDDAKGTDNRLNLRMAELVASTARLLANSTSLPPCLEADQLRLELDVLAQTTAGLAETAQLRHRDLQRESHDTKRAYIRGFLHWYLDHHHGKDRAGGGGDERETV